MKKKPRNIELLETIGDFRLNAADRTVEETEKMIGDFNREQIQGYLEYVKGEKTLAIIKPDGMKNIEKILEMIYKVGLKVEQFEVRLLDEIIVDEHYSHLLDKPFYPKLRNYIMSSEVAIMILSGQNAVDKFRNLMGPTDSTKAGNDTIRGKFGTDITYNAIHGSDSKESAEIEINRFFKQKQKRIND